MKNELCMAIFKNLLWNILTAFCFWTHDRGNDDGCYINWMRMFSRWFICMQLEHFKQWGLQQVKQLSI